MVRIFLTKTALDSVEERVELAIFGVLQKEFCPTPLQSDAQIKKVIKVRVLKNQIWPNVFNLGCRIGSNREIFDSL